MSQEYDPVEWVDETPTTPGTIINKARLDQMQSAHHYADGFEEVDTVPVADPEVGHHKVVYCTADDCFYRWSGSAWDKFITSQYIHDQGIASATWSITHNLNKHVQAQVQDTAGTVIVGRITEVDLNNITIEFNAATAGTAIIS